MSKLLLSLLFQFVCVLSFYMFTFLIWFEKKNKIIDGPFPNGQKSAQKKYLWSLDFMYLNMHRILLWFEQIFIITKMMVCYCFHLKWSVWILSCYLVVLSLLTTVKCLLISIFNLFFLWNVCLYTIFISQSNKKF